MRRHVVSLMSLLAFSLAGSDLEAQGRRRYEVSITNITKGQTFTPILVATHRPGMRLFELGEPATPELEALAETGDTGPLSMHLGALAQVNDVQIIGGLLGPGETASVVVDAHGPFRAVSVASMLIPTNDGFFALNGVNGPARGSESHTSPAYDAGTEVNDEICANIPGPQCGGSGAIDAGASEGGVVHVNAAIQGGGDLEPRMWDWRNPVARIVIRRVP